ncbi:MAG: Flp pilus assembly complex ATPase component TadA [Candidatus Omnitrophica bacterium]|nr:Flp pilus assembly complex ATPase component TadA [Candidatus Omnitrophota bacterium]
MISRKGDVLLGQMLIDKGIITPQQLDEGLKEQKKTGDFIGATLIRLGFAKEDDIFPVLSEKLNIPYIKLKDAEVSRDIIKKVPAKFASYYRLMPVKQEKNVLTVAVTDPLDLHTLDDIRLLLDCDINAVLASEPDIIENIKKYYGIGADTVDKIMEDAAKESSVISKSGESVEEMADDASIIKFVNEILQQAVVDRATDVHIEPFEDELRIRYRIDGVLHNVSIPPTIKYLHSAIISRIKIMASLNIAEKRLPQDGRIKIKVNDKNIDLRVSIIPTVYGENVSIRLLTADLLLSLESLGLVKTNLEIIAQMIKKPHGIIFVTGPTGSGKTTTLYACLNKINSSRLNIITIEDPIEYELKGITQVQIHPKIGLTFAEGLRHMLRHDPDIMMVGEVRDFETAEIAIRIALTGHLVFSTLHTNDASGAVARLLDMGIEPYLVSSSVECAIAQRLVRLICSKCKKEIKLDDKLKKELGLKIDYSKTKIYQGEGCPACKFTGFKGRTGIYEILPLTDEIRDLVLRRASADQIKQKAVALGMKTLFDDGVEKILAGVTTIGEVLRVTKVEAALEE